jgi:hypothetical protein
MMSTTRDLWFELIRQADHLASMCRTFEMRRRLNPHHPPQDIELETKRFNVEVLQRLYTLKENYAANKELLIAGLPQLPEETKKSAHSLIKAMEACFLDDLERTMLTDTDHITP